MRRLTLVVEVTKDILQFYKYSSIDQMFYIDHGNTLPNPFNNESKSEDNTVIQDKSYQLFVELNKEKKEE